EILCRQADKREQGFEMLRDVMKETQAQYPEDHPFTSSIAFLVAGVLDRAQCPEEAEAGLRLGMQAWNSPRHVWIQSDAGILLRFAWILESQHKFKEAEDAFHDAIDAANRFTPAQWQRHEIGSPLYFQVELAGLYDRLGRYDEAESLFERVRDELFAHM